MDKVYYYLKGDVKVGPFSLEELKKVPITQNTLIWRNPLPKWVYAHTLPELQDFFVKTTVPKTNTSTSNYIRKEPNYNKKVPKYNPPSIEKKAFNNTNIPYSKPETYLPLAILCTIFCCLPFGIISIIYSAKVSSAYKSGDDVAAQKASNNAKKWLILAFVSGLIWYVFLMYIGDKK